jgi:hypothetical protein
LIGELCPVKLFATDYQLREGFAEIRVESEMAGSSAVRWREHGATGLNSTAMARPASLIAMQGGFAFRSEQDRAQCSRSRSRGKRGCGVDRSRQYHDPEFQIAVRRHQKTIAGIVDGEFGPRSNIARSLC